MHFRELLTHLERMGRGARFEDGEYNRGQRVELPELCSGGEAYYAAGYIFPHAQVHFMEPYRLHTPTEGAEKHSWV